MDSLFIGSIQAGVLLGLAAMDRALDRGAALTIWEQAGRASLSFIALGLSLFLTGLYFVLLESSPRQATVGKLVLGLAVTDEHGSRIGFRRSALRFIGKILSALPFFFGYVLAAFSTKKRALHDFIAGTLVERRHPVGTLGIVGSALSVVTLLGSVGLGALVALDGFRGDEALHPATEAPTELRALAQAEGRHLAEQGSYLELAVPANGRPGSRPLEWDTDDLALARELGWDVAPPTYFTYRVVVAESDDGLEAYSACAEGDIDGDGKVSAWAVFEPLVNEDGEIEVEPPDAPCDFDPVLARSLSYGPGDPVGEPVRLSPSNVD